MTPKAKKMKKLTLICICFLFCGWNVVFAQSFTVIVCDQQEHIPIEAVTAIGVGEKGRQIFCLTGGKDGGFAFDKRHYIQCHYIQFSRLGYEVKKVHINKDELLDTLYLRSNNLLREVLVTGRQKLYRLKPDRLIYDVALDSTVQGQTAFDVMRNVPMLIVSRKGEIRAADERTIVYKMNGLRDPLLAGDIVTVLNSLPGNLIKRVEVITQPEASYNSQTTLVVNLVTKGKLEGYRASVSSEAQDNRWYNNVFALTKIKRFCINGNYSNLWMFDHDSNSSTDEYRYNDTDRYLYQTRTKKRGFRQDSHNVELTASYDIDDQTLLSAYGRMILKSDPHDSFSEQGFFRDNQNQLRASYLKNNRGRYDNKEWEGNLCYERLFGDEGSEGSFFAGYKYYGRPFDEYIIETYELPEMNQTSEKYFSNYYNYDRVYISREDHHTLETEYRRLFHTFHTIDLGGKTIYRNETEENTVRKSYLYPNDAQEGGDYYQFTRDQAVLMGYFMYIYQNNAMRFSASAYVQDQYDRLDQKDLNYRFSHNYLNVTPATSISYVLNPRCSFEFDYNMGLLRPDISALNPYVNKTNPLRWEYGNDQLKPERSQNFMLSTNFNLNKLYMRWAMAYGYADRVILNHRFLVGDILHITKGNIGIRHTVQLSGFLSSKVTKTSSLRLTPSLSYSVYRAAALGKSNRGFFFNLRGQWEQELPWNLFLELSGRYNTPYIWLEGKGFKDFGYNVTLSRSFLNSHLRISCSASNFSPIHYTRYSEYYSDNYASFSSSRDYHAAFSLNIRYSFGKLKASVKRTEKTIENDDIKDDYDE